MSVFAIYAFVITGLYIVYIGVVVMMDLFGKKRDKKDGVEVFSSEDMDTINDEEQSTVVDESGDGYVILPPGAQKAEDADKPAPVEQEDEGAEQEEEPIVENPDDEDILEQESLASQNAYESLKSIQLQMDAVTPSYQDEYGSSGLAVILTQPINNKTKILRKIVRT